MTIKSEQVSVRLPTKWRKIAESEWDLEGIPFTYSIVLRAAMRDYYEKNGWLDE